MKEFKAGKNEAGQRLDKYLKKILPNASMGFIYKMLRKKNIKLNDKKASGTEIVSVDDKIKIFLSDDTFAKFSVNEDSLMKDFKALGALKPDGLGVVYEDDDILAANKPVNMLSQKSKETDISANERLIGYLIKEGKLDFDTYKSFKPSVCNRLDRNTSGLILMGKSLHGLQYLSQVLKDRTAEKYYMALVAGEVDEPMTIEGFLTKDEAAVQENKKKKELQEKMKHLHEGGCPGSRMRMLEQPEAAESAASAPVQPVSRLRNWPVQIKLAPIHAPYFEGAKLLIAADCTAYAYANFHQEFMRGKVTLIGCPKLDAVDYSEKLTEILRSNDIQSVTILRMEVPCCGGLEMAAKKALQTSGKFIPWQVVTISIDGKILD